MKPELTVELVLLRPLFPILIFYILDKFFMLKIKSIKLFRSTAGYIKTIRAISLASCISFTIFILLTDNLHLTNWIASIPILYLYLTRIPKELC